MISDYHSQPVDQRRGSAAEETTEFAQPNRPNRLPHIPALDGLRGVAILLVLALHFGRVPDHASRAARLIAHWCEAGWIGVDLFFVLSGFLITRILLAARGEQGYFRNFYARRVLRILPIYYAVLAVIFLALPLVGLRNVEGFDWLRQNQAWLWLFGANIKMGHEQAFCFNTRWIYLSHFWSLAIEEHFYLVWPLIVLFLSRRTVGIACIACIAVSPLLRLDAHLLHIDPMWTYCYTPFRLDGLAAGALIAIAEASPRVGLRRLAAPAIAILLACFAGILFVGGIRGNLDPFFPIVQIAGYSLLIGIFAPCVLLVAVARPTSVLARALTTVVATRLGKYSYGIYVLHAIALPAFFRYINPSWIAARVHSQSLAILLTIACGSALSFTAAWISYNAFERHFLRLKRFFR